MDKDLLELLAYSDVTASTGLENKDRKIEIIANDFVELSTKNMHQIKDILIKLIVISDSFERVFQNIEEKKEAGITIDKQTKVWIGNFESIKKRIHRTLKDLEVMPIHITVGGEPDPALHEIVDTKEAQHIKEGHIIEEVEKGYYWRGQVLRPSKVITAQIKRG